jgi:hypothetical protein
MKSYSWSWIYLARFSYISGDTLTIHIVAAGQEMMRIDEKQSIEMDKDDEENVGRDDQIE